ncbi:MAG: DUF2807 domain-containing protein [Bacteroidales bacterium]|jgi:hypothetical protein|nr:DUF2807 domain-containing protein [Bacteroidales bacterium]HOI31482.1 DUF2807 domain-containing protein [Bacteroidales bacterium]
MNRKIILAIFLLNLFLLSGCKKSPGDCFTATGELITETRQLEPFNSIVMLDNIDVELVSGDSPMAEVIAGKNLLEKIETSVVDGELIIKNNNHCNFVRRYDKPLKTRVYFQQIDSIEYRSVGNLICLDTIINPDTFKIDVFEGAGNINLLINNYRTHLSFHYGTASLTASGYSRLVYIYQVSFGPIDARNLTSGFAYLGNNSTNNTWIRATTVLEATINSIGNVYYFGDPQTALSGSGSGGLIRLGD